MSAAKKMDQGYATEVQKLQERVNVLEDAIRTHRDAQGHSLCWLNDYELYSVLNEADVDNRDTLPPRDEFLTNCAKYYESRLVTLPAPKPKE